MKRICIALLIGCFIILSGGCRKSTPQLDLDPELVSDLVYGYRHTINVYEPTYNCGGNHGYIVWYMDDTSHTEVCTICNEVLTPREPHGIEMEYTHQMLYHEGKIYILAVDLCKCDYQKVEYIPLDELVEKESER